MASQEHEALIRQGTPAWNRWRAEHPWTRPDLSGANLGPLHLKGAILDRADLRGGRLEYADLGGTQIVEADLSGATLNECIFDRAELIGTRVDGSQIVGSSFVGARLTGVDLRNSNLKGSDLSGSVLTNVRLAGADVTGVTLGATVLANIDVSRVTGLMTVRHLLPSSVGSDTLLASVRGAGNALTAPLSAFFLSCGVPEALLDGLSSAATRCYRRDCLILLGGGSPFRVEQSLLKELEARGFTYFLYQMDGLDSDTGRPVWHSIGYLRQEVRAVLILYGADAISPHPVLSILEDFHRQLADGESQRVPVKVVFVPLDAQAKQILNKKSLDRYPFLKSLLLDRPQVDLVDARYEEAVGQLLAILREPGEAPREAR